MNSSTKNELEDCLVGETLYFFLTDLKAVRSHNSLLFHLQIKGEQYLLDGILKTC